MQSHVKWLLLLLSFDCLTVLTLKCICVCYRFPGGVKTGTREQTGPERAPETPDCTFQDPVLVQRNLIENK